MSFWSSQKLKSQIESNKLIEPFAPNQIDCASYTLRLGHETHITGFKNPTISQRLFPKANPIISIPPGQFGFLICQEIVSIPENAIGFISIKTKFKFKGLLNVSGFHVDPGYKGRLIFSVFNAGANEIQLKVGQDLFLLFIADLDENSEDVKNSSGYFDLNSDIRNAISGRIRSLDELKNEQEKLEKKVDNFTILVTLLAPLLGANLFFWLRYFFPV